MEGRVSFINFGVNWKLSMSFTLKILRSVVKCVDPQNPYKKYQHSFRHQWLKLIKLYVPADRSAQVFPELLSYIEQYYNATAVLLLIESDLSAENVQLICFINETMNGTMK
jgi:hypothetical protein